jgi:hypothetical protein
MPHRFAYLLATVWAGSLWTVGYLVAPTLFAVLDDRQVAGMIAGRLFRSEALLSVVCGVLLLVLANLLVRRGESAYRAIRWIVLAMLVCTLVGYFGVQPFMETLRHQAAALGVAVSESPYKTQFGMLHGISGSIYLLQSILGIVLIWRLGARPSRF